MNKKMKMKQCLLILLGAGIAQAAIIVNLPGTGVDLNNNGVDDNYSVTCSGGPCAPNLLTGNPSTIFPVPNQAPWTTAGIWLTPGNPVTGNPGIVATPGSPAIYDWRLRVTLPVDATGIVLTGQLAADANARVLIQGAGGLVDTGQTTTNGAFGGTATPNWAAHTPFTVNAANCAGCFVGGTPFDIVFRVLNGGDETGLNVKDLQLQYSVPEPSTWILSGLWLLGLSLYRRR
jgi:large exoprotein involved in heme utilization and adhesion